MLYVIRHGEVDTNIKNQVNGWNEKKLNNKGVIQAKEAMNNVEKLNIDVIFCSRLPRTKQTCYLINKNKIPVIYDERLKERNANSMTYASVKTLDNKIWYDKSKDIIYKDTEGFKNIIFRVFRFLEEIKKDYKDKNVLLVTHGDICKAIYLYFNPNTLDISDYHQDNCEIVFYEL